MGLNLGLNILLVFGFLTFLNLIFEFLFVF
jgi:hypothetical protein